MMRVAVAVFAGLVLAGSGALAACPSTQQKPQTAKERAQAENCVKHVNLGSVSAISANIVDAEPAPVVKAPAYTPPTKADYQGPSLGMSKPDPGVRPVPTVGYHWSLE